MENPNLTFEVIERHEVQNVPDEIQILMDLVGLIDKHFRKQRRPAFYAAALSLKEASLNKLCIEVLRTTIYKLIQDKIHNEGVRLLMTTDWSIKHIALEIGCSDAAYFIRCFKKKTGFSPNRYRNSGAKLTYLEDLGEVIK
nr:AraC family transcriptional regulator [Pedobacter panaciterrae]